MEHPARKEVDLYHPGCGFWPHGLYPGACFIQFINDGHQVCRAIPDAFDVIMIVDQNTFLLIQSSQARLIRLVLHYPGLLLFYPVDQLSDGAILFAKEKIKPLRQDQLIEGIGASDEYLQEAGLCFGIIQKMIRQIPFRYCSLPPRWWMGSCTNLYIQSGKVRYHLLNRCNILGKAADWNRRKVRAIPIALIGIQKVCLTYLARFRFIDGVA